MRNPPRSHQRQKKQKSKKERGSNLSKTLKVATCAFLVTIFLQIPQVSSSSLYQITTNYVSTGYSLSCNDATKTVFYALRVKKKTVPVSVNLVTNSIPSSQKFISDTAFNKRYGYYQAGTNCYYHTDNNKDPLFVLVISNNGATQNKCKVVGIITEQDLQPCGATDTEDLFSYGPIKLNNADNTASANHLSFQRVLRNQGYDSLGFYAMYYELSDFSVGAINLNIVEMIVLNLMNLVNTNQPLIGFDGTALTAINDQLHFNSFASEMKPETFIPRIIHDDLPGYHLGVYTGPADDPSKFVQKTWYMSSAQSNGFIAECYIQKPDQILVGEVHAIEISVKGYKSNAAETIDNMKHLNYRIEVSKTTTELKFQVKRDGSIIPTLTVSLTDTGNQKFVHFCLTVSGGLLYYVDASNVRAKYYEILHAFQEGLPAQRAQTSYQETTTLGKIMPARAGNEVRARWAKMEFKPPSGVTTNKAAIRGVQLAQVKGVYPPYLVANVDNSANFPRCYFNGYRNYYCYAMGMLSDATETQALKFRSGNSYSNTMNGGIMRDSCRMAFSINRCVSPRPGYIINLDVTLKTPLPNYGSMTIADYNALGQEIKNLATTVTSNLNTKYLLTCPYTCKREQNFSQNFNFLGGTCGIDRKCLTCPDGATPDANGECPLTSCSSINYCKHTNLISYF